MNQFVAQSTIRLAGASTIRPITASRLVVDRSVLAKGDLAIMPDVPPALPLPESLPLAGSQSGNLFVDRNDASLHWYLPDFTLVADIDPAFAFTASQAGQDSAGNPFNTAKLTLRIQKVRPLDVDQFAQANPSAALKEIPLPQMTAAVISSYIDEGGLEQQRTCNGTVADAGQNLFLLTFDNILSASVIGLYQDLTSFGKAVVQLSASYEVWSAPQLRLFPSNVRVIGLQEKTAALPRATMIARPTAFASPAVRSFAPISKANVNVATAQPTPPPLVKTSQGWQKQLPLTLKYKQDGYQLCYTVATSSIPNHVIRDAKDLKDFSKSQSEFEELKALVGFNESYPSISRLFIGVLSRTIIAIPQRYSILRSHVGCAAACFALADNAATDGSRCKFEFDFTIAPEVSRIEFLKLGQELKRLPDLKDYTLKLPDCLNDTPPSSLQTTFKSTVDFGAGTEAHTFGVTVSIRDDGSAGMPAVANANLFISRLCSGSGADLIGALSLKLDDGYPDPVLSTLVLNFGHTTGTDELVAELDEADAQIKVTNASSLDLRLSRYALIQDVNLTEVPSVRDIAANGSIVLPLPGDPTGLSFAADAQLVVPSPLPKSDTAKFLQFSTVVVQETQYLVAVNASGVNFNRVESIAATLTFASLPNLTPQTLNFNKNRQSDNIHIVIPLTDAMFSLPGSVQLKVHFVDATINDLDFTLQNDFTAEPVLILLQSEIDKNLSRP